MGVEGRIRFSEEVDSARAEKGRAFRRGVDVGGGAGIDGREGGGDPRGVEGARESTMEEREEEVEYEVGN